MERLTIPDKPIEGGIRRAVVDARAVKEQALTLYWALKKYEDTGLTPEEIMDGRLLMGWIPVADRLPETSGVMLEDEKILIKLADGTRTISFYINTVQGKKIFFDGWDTYNPIAWMPLPESLDLQN